MSIHFIQSRGHPPILPLSTEFHTSIGGLPVIGQLSWLDGKVNQTIGRLFVCECEDWGNSSMHISYFPEAPEGSSCTVQTYQRAMTVILGARRSFLYRYLK